MPTEEDCTGDACSALRRLVLAEIDDCVWNPKEMECLSSTKFFQTVADIADDPEDEVCAAFSYFGGAACSDIFDEGDCNATELCYFDHGDCVFYEMRRFMPRRVPI